MAGTMTTHERMTRMFAHREADRIPITDSPWGATIERWQREGLPKGQSFVDYFGLDQFRHIGVDNSPRYPERLIEETDAYTVRFSRWGATLKNWKHAASTPEFVDFTIKSPDDWRQAKARMTPSDDRIPWANLKANYRTWRTRRLDRGGFLVRIRRHALVGRGHRTRADGHGRRSGVGHGHVQPLS